MEPMQQQQSPGFYKEAAISHPNAAGNEHTLYLQFAQKFPIPIQHSV